MNQQTIIPSLLLLLSGAFSASSLCAQSSQSAAPIAYGYNHTIETAVGNVQNLKRYPHLPDQGIALLYHDALDADLSLRYSRFFTRHWGAFAQLDAFCLEGVPEHLYDALSQSYNHEGREARITYNEPEGFSSSHGMYLFGAVYRYDIGRWSFRPRFGVGKIHQHSTQTCFYVVDTHTEYDHEFMTLSTTDRDGRHVQRFNALAYAPAMQIAFSCGQHFFLSAELQWTGTIGHLYQNLRADQYRATEPQDWQPESDSYFYIKGPDEYIGKVSELRERVQMGHFLQFRIGIGWNIGRNRGVR